MHLIQAISKVVNTCLTFVYPEVCQFCLSRPATHRDGYICGNCRSGVKLIEPPWCDRCGLPVQGAITTDFKCGNCSGSELFFRFARAAASAEGCVLDAIHRYKYQQALWVEPFLAELLVSRASSGLRQSDWDFIVPVPLHPTKRRERHFNQAERLARRLGEATGIPVNARVVQRIAFTRTQTRLSREERLLNVSGAFALKKGANVAKARVIVVDDVFTTGSTTNACARELVRGGVDDVCVWTVARGI